MTGPAARLWVKLLLVPATPRWADPREVGAIAWTFGANAMVHRATSGRDPRSREPARGRGSARLRALRRGITRRVGPRDRRPATRRDASDWSRARRSRAASRSRPRSPRPADTSPTAGSPRSATHAPRTSCSCAYRSAPRWRRNCCLRSALTALFAQRHSWRTAVAVSAAVFGLWHVLPTVESIDSHPGRRADRRGLRPSAPRQSRESSPRPCSPVSHSAGCSDACSACSTVGTRARCAERLHLRGRTPCSHDRC